jgi:hypothetical protein
MAKTHPGATLVPHFREFLPEWLSRQEWYIGSGIPTLTPVGYFRFEDPDGEVGIETHLLRDASVLYQIPMTYRGAPLTDPLPGVTGDPLIATSEHSVLGTRWFYDGAADPVWRGELLGLVGAETVSDPSSKRGVGPAEARGRRTRPGELEADSVTVELNRVLSVGGAVEGPDVAGVVMGTWHPDGPDSAQAGGCLAVLRAK